MARYVVHVLSPRSPAEAFEYMADLSNFAEWDPGVERAEQVEGDRPELDAAFDVRVKAGAGSITLRYRITEYDAPSTFVARAQNLWLTSLDTITVVPSESGSLVTYDADLTLNGLLGLLDPVLGLGFNPIGDRAAAGLIRALDGVRVDDPEP